MAGLSGGGGGGDSGAIQAGRAFVSMGVRDDTKVGLAEAAKKLQHFGKRAKSIIGSIADEGSVIGGLARGGILGAGFAVIEPMVQRGIDHLAESLSSSKEKAEEFQRAMELSAKAAEHIANRAKEAVERLEEWKGFGAGADLMNFDAQVAEMDKRIGELRKELFGLNRRIATDKDLSDDEKAKLEKGRGPILERLEELTGQREKIKQGRERFEDPTKDPDFLRRLQNMGQDIADATDPAIQGMGELEKKVRDMTKDRPLGLLADHVEKLRIKAREADRDLKLQVGHVTREIFKLAQKKLEMDTKFFATRGVQGGPGLGQQLRFAESFQRVPDMVQGIERNTEEIKGELKANGNELKKLRMGAP